MQIEWYENPKDTRIKCMPTTKEKLREGLRHVLGKKNLVPGSIKVYQSVDVTDILKELGK